MLSFVAGFTAVAAVLGAVSPETEPNFEPSVPSVFENVELSEIVDVTAAYTRDTLKVVAENIASEPASQYYISLSYEDADCLAAIEAEDGIGPLRIYEASEYHDEENAYFGVNLRAPVVPGDQVELTIGRAYIGKTYPLPRKAEQSDTQMLAYSGSRTIASPYRSRTQTLTIKTVTQNVLDIEKNQAQSGGAPGRGGLVKFGPFENVKPNVRTKLTLQYENPLPQLHFPRLDRTVWVSHWGDAVSFDETYELQNIGTELKGGFSRLDFMRSNEVMGFNLNMAAIRQLVLSVPSPARDLYYVDLVGNVSTSRVHDTQRDTKLEVTPRYPVFGGWHYNFTVGWTNPLGQFVHKTESGRYVLAVPLLTGSEDASYDEVSTKIILPEGAANVEFGDIYGNTAESSTVYSYLDFQGRPALEVVHRKLVTDHRSGLLLVSYDYSVMTALRKPVILATAVLAVFVAAFYGTKIDWSI